MKGSGRVAVGLFAVILALLAACTPTETVRVSPAPTSAAPTAAAPSPSPTRSPSPTPSASPTPSPTTAPTTSPGSTPPAACAAQTGGSPLAGSLLTDIRAAHQPGFDRLVFEWSGAAVPQFEVKVANSFTAPSGQAVPVSGNAFISVRMTGQAHTNTTPVTRSYGEPDPFAPSLPVVRQVKLIEDFEGVVVFGVGLERLVCPTILTLTGPSRLVLDFATAP